MSGKGKNTSVKQTLPVISDVEKPEKAEILKAREKTSTDTEIKDKSDENKSKMMRTKTVGEQNLLKGHGIKNSFNRVEEGLTNQKTDVIKISKSEESRKNQKEIKTVLINKEDTKTTNQNNKDNTKTTNQNNKENTKTTNQNNKENTKTTNQNNKEDNKTTNQNNKEHTKTTNQNNKENTKTTNQNNKEDTKTTNQNKKADKEVEKSKAVVKTISNDKDNSKTIRKPDKLSLTSRNEDNKIDPDNHDKVEQKMKTKNEIDSKTITNKIVGKQTMKTNSLYRKSDHNKNEIDLKKESRDLSDIRKYITLPKSINTNTREQKKKSFSIATTTASDHWTLIAAGEEMHFKKEEVKERNKILLVEIEKEPCENVSSFENWVLVARGNVPIHQTSLHQANDMWIPTAQGSDIINGGIIQLDKLDMWSKEIKEDLGKSRKPGNYGTVGPYDSTRMEFFHYNMRNEWDKIQMPIQHCEFVREHQDYSLSTSEQIQLYFFYNSMFFTIINK